MWTRTLFNYERRYDERTNSTKVQTVGTLGTEDVYEMPFNEKNLKELFSLRANDADIMLIVKDEVAGKPTSLRKEPNIQDTLKLFQKPFNYLLNAEYITPQQRAQLRQMAINEGIIAPSTPLESTDTAPPKGTYTQMSEGKFYDCFGQELKAKTCEYCGETKPIKYWSSIENGKVVFTILMVEYTRRDGQKVWTCKERQQIL